MAAMIALSPNVPARKIPSLKIYLPNRRLALALNTTPRRLRSRTMHSISVELVVSTHASTAEAGEEQVFDGIDGVVGGGEANIGGECPLWVAFDTLSEQEASCCGGCCTKAKRRLA